MDSLLLHNFKAFKDNFTLNPNGDNVLIYGENGSGKSSLFEGIKLFYFRERLLRESIAPNIVGQARIDEERQVLDEYKYDDNEFFVELTKQSGNLEDMIVEAGNHPTDQKKFRQDIQSSLESIYKLIDKKRTGQKI